MKLFNSRKKDKPAEQVRYAHDGLQVFDLHDNQEGVYEDYLFGDFNATGRYTVLPDFTIDFKLSGLYDELDKSLDVIFANGEIDSCNGDMYDSRIDSAGVIALRSAESQYASIMCQPVQKAVSLREADIIRLAEMDEMISRELEDVDAELAALLAKEEEVNHFKPRRRIS